MMTRLQEALLFDIALNYVVLSSICNLALGIGNLWVLGFGSLLGAGGLFAWLTASGWSTASALAVTAVGFALVAISLGAVAGRLPGDEFATVSLASAFATNAGIFSVVGSGISSLGFSDFRTVSLAGMCGLALGSAAYVSRLQRTRLRTSLLIVRDRNETARVERVHPESARFWLHSVAAAFLFPASVLAVTFYDGYSPGLHSTSRCLLWFGATFAFGLNSARAALASALVLSLVPRIFRTILEGQSAAYIAAALGFSDGDVATAYSGVLSELTLALFFLASVRLHRGSLFGAKTSWV